MKTPVTYPREMVLDRARQASPESLTRFRKNRGKGLDLRILFIFSEDEE